MADIHPYSSHEKADALEAFQSMRMAQNFCFTILLLGLLALIGVFLVVSTGKIDSMLEIRPEEESVFVNRLCTSPKYIHTSQDSNELNSDVPLVQDIPAIPSPNPMPDPLMPTPPEETTPNRTKNAQLAASLDKGMQILLKITNFTMTFMVLLYSLTLLVGIKFAIVGRLGGLKESTKGFFISLILLVLTVPWVKTISPSCSTVLFSYSELITAYKQLNMNNEIVGMGLYYCRFMGLWLLALILLLLAQYRSHRGVKRVLARIEAEQNAQQTATPGYNINPQQPVSPMIQSQETLPYNSPAPPQE